MLYLLSSFYKWRNWVLESSLIDPRSYGSWLVASGLKPMQLDWSYYTASHRHLPRPHLSLCFFFFFFSTFAYPPSECYSGCGPQTSNISLICNNSWALSQTYCIRNWKRVVGCSLTSSPGCSLRTSCFGWCLMITYRPVTLKVKPPARWLFWTQSAHLSLPNRYLKGT